MDLPPCLTRTAIQPHEAWEGAIDARTERLFLAASARRLEPLAKPPSWPGLLSLIDLSERYAEPGANPKIHGSLLMAHQAMYYDHFMLPIHHRNPVRDAVLRATDPAPLGRQRTCDALTLCQQCDKTNKEQENQERLLTLFRSDPLWSDDWRTSTTHALAETTYQQKAWDKLPVLADALEEAGCDHPLLRFLRADWHHAHRGMFFLDALTGRR
jgi:hypothetical protein